jgi:hypothetical protein
MAKMNTTQYKPKALFSKKMVNKNRKVMLFDFSSEQLKSEEGFIKPDSLNPRIKNDYDQLSNEDLEQQILRNGQISDAIGRFVTDEDGVIQYNENGMPLISILDGLRRFSSCVRMNRNYSIIVGFFNDIEAQEVINSAVNSQQDLSNLELGFHIDNIEQSQTRLLNNKEIVQLLGYEKSRQAVASARKALGINRQYPTLFTIFPVASLVGKSTINKVNEIVKFAQESHQIEKLIEFSKSSAFEYNDSEDSILSPNDLIEFDSKKNKVITNALAERVGFIKVTTKKSDDIEVNKHVSFSVKENTKSSPRSQHTIVIEADLKDDERVLTERFLKILTESNQDSSEYDITEQFELFLRRIERN